MRTAGSLPTGINLPINLLGPGAAVLEGAASGGSSMKRYLIFGAIGPFVAGFLMLLATTVASGYWTETNWTEISKFLGAFFKTLQYSYLFGIVPALMVGAIDDILCH